MVSKETKSAHNWISILVAVTALLVIGGFIWMHWDHSSETDSLTTISNDLATIYSTLPIITVLPDASPLDCARRVQTTMGADVFITKNEKPDGSTCEDSCLSSASARTCVDGECVGTCAGLCPATHYAYDPACPVIGVSDFTYGFAFAYFQRCANGLCTYWVIFDTSTAQFVEFNVPTLVDYSGHGPGFVEYAGDTLCKAHIADNDPSKACLVSSFSSINSFISGPNIPVGVCAYAFECGSASLYAGQSSGLGSMNVKSTNSNVKAKSKMDQWTQNEVNSDESLQSVFQRAADQIVQLRNSSTPITSAQGTRSRTFGPVNF